MPPLPQLTPVARIVEQAELHPARVMPALTHQSYPTPVRAGRTGLQMVFFFGHGEIVEPRQGLQLWPPNYVAYLSAHTGKFEELRAVAPGDFGQRHPADQPFGKYLTLVERVDAAFMNKLVLWYQAFDAILPCFAAGNYGLSADQQQAARDFSRLAPDVLEEPLLPYYKAAAREFWEWLGLMARTAR